MAKNCDNCKHHDIEYEFDYEIEDEVEEEICLKNHKKEFRSDCECPYFEEYKPKPYVERDTECDNCEFLKKCIDDGKLIEITTIYDRRKHYARKLGLAGQPICRPDYEPISKQYFMEIYKQMPNRTNISLHELYQMALIEGIVKE